MVRVQGFNKHWIRAVQPVSRAAGSHLAALLAEIVSDQYGPEW